MDGRGRDGKERKDRCVFFVFFNIYFIKKIQRCDCWYKINGKMHVIVDVISQKASLVISCMEIII